MNAAAWIKPPESTASSYTVKNARVPVVLLSFAEDNGTKTDDVLNSVSSSKGNPEVAFGTTNPSGDRDGLVLVDITVKDGIIARIKPSSEGEEEEEEEGTVLDAKKGVCMPTFCDIHTHVDKSHTCERSRNESGSLAGADKSCQIDEIHWTEEELMARMEFSLKTAYAHGTSAIRTHLMSGPTQGALTWPAFMKLREKWKGRIELQGVSLSILSFFKDEHSSRNLARTVKAHKGILGAAVSCSDYGGTDLDPHTTCGDEIHALLDKVFQLAIEFELDLDFHVDENGNEESKGLLHISDAAIRNNYKGQIVCGHCCSLAAQTAENLEIMLQAAKRANITIVSLPMVNQWLQNRCELGEKTPRRRGIPLLKEITTRNIPVCLASDNIRDQFYGYGDLDMLEVFRLSVFIAHLDRPSLGDWPKAVTTTPAQAMGIGETHGLLKEGGPANFVIFRGRQYSELFSRSQHDRLVVRNGKWIATTVPNYDELDPILDHHALSKTQPLIGSNDSKENRKTIV
jgi:cytosine/adenosine deaminase-related metal-dependent hydrolase